MADLPREVLSYEQIRGRATEFLKQHHPSGTIPIPIEHIAEADLGIDIVPVPGLQDALVIDHSLFALRIGP